ncbi:MAG: radical SAM protein [Candidatus Helarchaeota archaeon]|nr:radical SAM protein [Candidatus Helarchaeota archaeon]
MNQKAHELVFPKFHHYKPKPHHPDWDEMHREAGRIALKIARNISHNMTPLSGTFFQKRKILALLKTLRALFINKRRMAKGSHNFIPIFYIWTMTNQCNFLCSYCSNHRGGKYPTLYREGLNKNLTTEQGKRLIKIMKGSSAIYFCGGEPTLHKDLPELLDYSTKLNMFNMINTNGSLIGDLLLEPRYKNFLAQMDVIIISLDSLSIPKLSKLYEVKDRTSRKVLRNILTLRILQNFVQFKLVANTVITRDTIEDSFDILDWCCDLGICFSPVSANIGHEPDHELIKNPRYQELVDKILERAKQGYPMIASVKMLDQVLRATDIHCYPTVFDHIDYNGELFWPCKAYSIPAMVNVLNYKNVNEVHKAAEKLINPIDFHGDGKNQCKGHCAWMQDVVTDTYGKALLGLFDSGIFNEIRSLIG